ncbi:hypothetical protein [Pedobacter cryotolerans]|uniref:hypothetical protein n=1 Tax=Pedobacter cryotolerans TaxID=2571270 RepID=UPI00198141BF|nr:hypothetical protein [Pedobacter cryotolerans]
MNSYNPPALFIYFKKEFDVSLVPNKFSLIENTKPHPLCVIAAEELQNHILTQKEWQHNFGLDNESAGMIIGKMFGVLVVQNQQNEIGYLAAFSGKLAGANQHDKFVPPVFDLLTENGFLNIGMKELTLMNKEIKRLLDVDKRANATQIEALKVKRKSHSIALQNKIFNQYHFLNQAGETKSLIELFRDAGYKNPPAGAGECAGPKLLQYAFLHQLKPLALSEFWWGLSPKSATWKHKEFYACCKEKCEPILAHMLNGL